MKDSKELANQILTDIAEINPYRGDQKHLAFVWAAGFLARCVAEMIWRDSDNSHVYRRLRDRARESRRMAPLSKSQK